MVINGLIKKYILDMKKIKGYNGYSILNIRTERTSNRKNLLLHFEIS